MAGERMFAGQQFPSFRTTEKTWPMDTYIRAVNFLSRVAGVFAAFLIAARRGCNLRHGD